MGRSQAVPRGDSGGEFGPDADDTGCTVLHVDMDAFYASVEVRRLGRPVEIAALIRRRVAAEQRLTCSVGVAPTKFVAKLASTRAKPDGLAVVPAGKVLDYLHPLPVGALWGVGERSAETLRRLGLTTVRDLAEAPPSMLRGALGAAAATRLHELA